MSLQWKLILVVSLLVRFFLAVQNSYIHPDEHFQNFNIIYNVVSKTNATVSGQLQLLHHDIPWEFSAMNPARSLIPLYVIYYPIFKLFQDKLDPLKILYVLRLIFCFSSWIIIDYSLIKLSTLSSRKNLISIILIYTSYVIWVYQSHTFSNSIETIVLLLCLLVINSVKVQCENYEFVKNDRSFDLKKNDDALIKGNEPLRINNNFKKLIALAFLINFGVFNRVTFASFLGFPSFYLLKFFFSYKKFVSLVVFGISGMSFFLIFSLLDTKLYEKFHNINPSLIYSSNFEIFGQNLIIAPLNNLLYNTDYSNLSKHGIHPRYNHITVNLFQVLGPLYLVFAYNLKDYFKYLYIKFKLRNVLPQRKVKLLQNPQYNELSFKGVIFATIISGLFFLSLIPHQELRFLIPLQPLILKVIDFEFLNEKFEVGGAAKQQNNEQTSDDKNKKDIVIITPKAKMLIRNILVVWYIFNAALGILMGMFHQGGILTALNYIYEQQNLTANSESPLDNEKTIYSGENIQLWWRTYPPPTWLLNDSTLALLKYDDQIVQSSSQNLTYGDNLNDLMSFNYGAEKVKNVVIDTMGMDVELLDKLMVSILLSKQQKRLFLIMPISSYQSTIVPFYALATNLNPEISTGIQFEQKWFDFYHLDMDHLDLKHPSPGIGIYSVTI